MSRAVGPFELGERISRSASSEVFSAAERATGAACIIKKFSSAGQATREGRALAALDGERAPQLLSRQTVDGDPALVLEKLTGQALDDWANATPAEAREAQIGAILTSLANALAEVHARDVIHGDLKPDHIVIGADGRVRFLDFASSAAPGDRASAVAARWLTPGFSAPETDPNFSGDEPLGPWSDYFSVGAILFWLEEARAPGDGDLDKPAGETVGLSATARRLLRRRSSERPLSADEFRNVLLAGGSAVEKLSPSPSPSPAPPKKPPPDATVFQEPAPKPESDEADKRTVIPDPDAPIDADQVGAAPDGDTRDPIPPTVKVRRREPGRLPDPPVVEAAPRRGGVSWLAIAACIAVLLAAGGAGYQYGWPLYERLYKKSWIVDPVGEGDALTLAEALDRAGPDVEILLAAGEHVSAPIVNRAVALSPVEGLAEPPVLIGGDEPCLRLEGARVLLSAVTLARADGAETGGCLNVTGGEAVLARVSIERAKDAALIVEDGAAVRASEVELSNPDGTGLIVESGGSVEAKGLIIGGALGSGAVVEGGGALTGEGVKIVAVGGAGLAVGEGGEVVLAASEVDGAKGSGVELTEGANADLTDMLIDSSGGAGVALYDGARLLMDGGAIASSAMTGVFADGAAELTLLGLSITDSGEHGALLLDLSGGEIAGVEITGSEGIGLGVFPGAEVDLEDNKIVENKGGDLIDARPPKPDAATEAPSDAPTDATDATDAPDPDAATAGAKTE